MNKHDIIFAWLGSILSILFFLIVNFLTSPNYLWFLYPSFLILFWPLSITSIRNKNYRVHSIFSSLLLIMMLIIINYTHSPEHPWFLYACYPIIWWPLLLIAENRRGAFSFALLGATITIVYYSILNILLSPQYPWVIYPAFVVLWWPLSIFHTKKREYFKFSISSSALIIIFFITVNIVSSPHTIWAVYPIFAVLWWPLSMYYYTYKKKLM